MAFPVSSVLDSFDRADGAVGANWTKLWSGDLDLQIVSNLACCNTANGWANGGWNGATYGPDCEGYVTISTVSNTTRVYARVNSLGTAGGPSGYRVSYDGFSEVKIERMDSGTATLLGALITKSFSNGDAFGIEVVGSTITCYRKPSGGSWASLGSRTDTTYSSAGYIGLELYHEITRVNDFGGGEIAVATSVQLATRARNDNGSESTATTIADGNFTAPLDTTIRLRAQIDTSGDVANTTYQIEAQKQGDLVWAKVA
jgi:hypothetical protein